MISHTLQGFMLVAVVLYFVLLFQLLKKKRLYLKYALLWILSGCIMLGLALFPEMLSFFAHIVGIYDPTNALFAIAFFCIILILMSLTAIVSKLNERVKRLAQSIALLEERLREIEEHN